MKRDAFDPVAVAAEREERQYREEQRRLRTSLLLERVMTTKEGREVIGGLLDLTGVNASVFDVNPAAMAYREGRRSVGLDLVSIIRPEQYQLMLKERYERRSAERGAGGDE